VPTLQDLLYSDDLNPIKTYPVEAVEVMDSDVSAKHKMELIKEASIPPLGVWNMSNVETSASLNFRPEFQLSIRAFAVLLTPKRDVTPFRDIPSARVDLFPSFWAEMDEMLLQNPRLVDFLLRLIALVCCGLPLSAFEWLLKKLTSLAVRFRSKLAFRIGISSHRARLLRQCMSLQSSR